jgi:DNA-binding transcriptional ArsR family regulator
MIAGLREDIRVGDPRYAGPVASSIPLTERARERMAARFRALGDPTRLNILERLFQSPASVGELVEHVRGTQANVSKHLGVLRSQGLVGRRKQGNRTVYSIADPSLERICAVVCAALGRDARAEAEALAPLRARKRTRSLTPAR